MKVDEIVKELALENAEWMKAYAEQTLEEGSLPFFMEPEILREFCQKGSLSDEATEGILVTMKILSRQKALCHYLHLMRLHVLSGLDKKAVSQLEIPSNCSDIDRNAFRALLCLSCASRVEFEMKEKGISSSIIKDTLADLAIHTEDCKIRTGHWGLDQGSYGWILFLICGRIFKVGRLQYILRPFQEDFVVYRNKQTRQVKMLSPGGVTYRGEGLFANPKGYEDPENEWVSVFEEDEFFIQANPIGAKGYALKEPVKLDKKSWSLILKKGDPVMDMHIRRASPMDWQECGESLKQALVFFDRHFPEIEHQTFVCVSWILDPRLEELLPHESNLGRFQREFHLYPKAGGEAQMLERVFDIQDGDRPDLKKLKAKSSLQKAILDFMVKGGRMRTGGCFLMREDLKWGSQVYLKNKG